MGRGKNELIKDRNSTFKARKNCMMKKASELSTLCGVEVGLIIYGGQHQQAETFPPKQDEVKAVISRYNCKRKRPAVEDLSGDRVAALLNSRIQHVQELILSKEKTELLSDDQLIGKLIDDGFVPEKRETVSTAFDVFPGEGFVDWDAVMKSVQRSPPAERQGFKDLDALIDSSIDFLLSA